jgi:hypothetical protein
LLLTGKLTLFRRTFAGLILILILILLVLAPSAALAGAGSSAGCTNDASPGFRAYLPDCRGYELLTPPYAESTSGVVEAIGADVEGDGPRLLIDNFGSFSGVENQTGLGAQYTVDRTNVPFEGWESGRWGSAPLDVPFAVFPISNVIALSPSFERSLWTGLCLSGGPRPPQLPEGCRPPTPEHGEGVEDLYLRNPDGSFTWVGPGGPPAAKERVATVAGASDDLTHVVFEALVPARGSNVVRLWPGDATGGEGQPSLYEYVGMHNAEPQLVGVRNAGPVASIGESDQISDCGTFLGSAEGDAYNAVSSDGSTIFFTALGREGTICERLPPDVQPAVNELYARIDGERTVAISEPTAHDCGACNTQEPARARFGGASLDGSKVFFTTRQRLHLGGEGGEGEYLYEYDFDAPAGSRVTLVSGGDPAGARVQGVARVSADGSHVYFVAQGVLTGEQANVYGVKAREGAENLYAAIRECPGGGTGCVVTQQRLSFIGQLSPADSPDWSESDRRPVQATPDGRFLVFDSSADMTPDEGGREEAGQVFEFDAQTGALLRVSRGEGGYNEDGNSKVHPAVLPVQNYERDSPTLRFTRTAVSDDGSYVFFMTDDALTPQALTGVRNVYEYHGGSVRLISGGHDLAQVEGGPGVALLGTDASGRDVLFATTEQLLPQDTNTQQDVYDARIGGGQAPSVTRAACAGDSCQSAASAPPALLVSMTSSIVGEPAASVPAAAPAARKKAKVKAMRKKKRRAKSTKGRGKSRGRGGGKGRAPGAKRAGGSGR